MHVRHTAAALAFCGWAAAAHAEPDFSGVWQPVSPPLQLKQPGGEPPPLLASAQKISDEHIAMLKKHDRSFDRTSTRCAPPGEPRILTEDMPFDIVQTKRELAFGYQWNRLVRFVKFDAKMDVLSPYYFGTSVGHFNGNTLVVDAEGFNDRFYLDRAGLPHSNQLKLTEYYTLGLAGKTMEARIHIEDPATFSQPWDTVLHFRKVPNGRIVEDICTMREGLIPPELKFFDPK